MNRAERASRDARYAAGKASLEANAFKDAALATITSVIRECVENKDDSGPFSSATMASRLRAEGLEIWAEAAEAYARSPRPASDPCLVALQILVGRAAGDLCGRRLDGAAADFASDVRQMFFYETTDFVSAMTAALEGQSFDAGKLVGFLRNRAEAKAAAPSRFIAPRDHSAPDKPEARRFREVWEGPLRRTIPWVDDAVLYAVLRRIAPRTFLDVIETYPHEEGIYALLEAADREATHDELVALLAQARPVFDASGVWEHENQAAFILLDLIRERLFEERLENGQPSTEFSNSLATLVDVLAGRSDALPLAYAWLQRIVSAHGKSRRPFRNYGHEDAQAVPFLMSIANALANKFPDLPKPIEWIEAEEMFWRKERVHTLIAVQVSRLSVDKVKLKSLLEDVLFRDFVGSHGLGALVTDQRSFESLIVGNAIFALDDPAAWLDDIWRRLFWQRDRACVHRNVDQNLPNAGQVICTWTMLGLAYFPSGSKQAVQLWLALERAVRESCLMDWFRQPNDTWCLLLRFLGAIWSRTFPHDPPAGEPGSLDDFVSSWLQVDLNLASLAVVMSKQGITPIRLREAGISAELLRRIVQDGTPKRRHQLMQKPEAESVLALAAEIEASVPSS